MAKKSQPQPPAPQIYTYHHSGALGDIIYALAMFRKIPPGKLLIALENCDHVCTTKYGYGKSNGSHLKTLTKEAFTFLKPLLELQPYLRGVDCYYPALIPPPEGIIDLDDFRHILFKGFRGNYVEGYYKSFGVPFTIDDVMQPWLKYNQKERIAPIVVARTPRYQSPNGILMHKKLAAEFEVATKGIFIGTVHEHTDYEQQIGIKIPHFQIKDHLQMLQVIAGADLLISNQTFAYSLAMGIGQSTILETVKDKSLSQNECYFPRSNCKYF